MTTLLVEVSTKKLVKTTVIVEISTIVQISDDNSYVCEIGTAIVPAITTKIKTK